MKQKSAPSTPEPEMALAAADIESGGGLGTTMTRTSARKVARGDDVELSLAAAADGRRGDEKSKDELDGVSPWVLAVWKWLRYICHMLYL